MKALFSTLHFVGFVLIILSCFLLCERKRGYFLASLQQPLEERIEIKITGRKASGSIKGCGPEEALASKFMAF